MSAYGRIYSAQLARWAGWTGDEIAVAVYLRASRHANTEGLAEIPAAYIAHDRRWTVERVEGILLRLVERGDIVRDGDWVLVLDALEYQQPKTGAHLKGAANRVESAPRESEIYVRFLAIVQQRCPALLDHLPAATPMPSECHAGSTHEARESDAGRTGVALASTTTRSTTTTRSSSRQTTTTPQSAVRPNVDRACDLIEAAGLSVPDRSKVQDLADEHPAIDVEAAAHNCAAWLREAPRHAKDAPKTLRPFLTASDAPRLGAPPGRPRVSATPGARLDHYTSMHDELPEEEAA